MKKIKLILISLVALIGVVSMVPNFAHAAVDPAEQARTGVTAIGGSGSKNTNLGSRIAIVVNILLYLLGAISVVMIVIGGIRYTTSNGDSSAITGAKNTILYAVVGLVIASIAYAIVNFVLTAF